jgi:hypothetical protein
MMVLSISLVIAIKEGSLQEGMMSLLGQKYLSDSNSV